MGDVQCWRMWVGLLCLSVVGAGGCGGIRTTPETEDNPSGYASDGLGKLINDYRKANGLPAIRYSASLTAVAEAHVQDLRDEQPDEGSCNLHSWSDAGSWSSCCYTDDGSQAQCMWDKPRELTDYEGDGFEVAAYSSVGMTPEYALELWQSSSGHNQVLLNQGMWAQVTWNALGVAILDGYAVAWFGQETE